MKILRKSITFDAAEYEEAKARMADLLIEYEQKLRKYERFEDDVRDAMDEMEPDEHYHRLNTALARLL